jgi:acetyl esterase/lipase
MRLWTDGPPTRIECVPGEVAYTVRSGIAAGTTFLRNVSDPTLTVFSPRESANGTGVIVVPGGGWTINAWAHEGLDVARWLAARGYTAFLLKYRVQASDPDQRAFEARMAEIDARLAADASAATKPRAISDLISTNAYLRAREACADDGRRAIELVRERAEGFGVRPGAIGMIGFSAGAFLAVDIALDPRAEQVAFIAPIYGGETRGVSVPSDAPPLFTAVAQDDVLVKIVEGLHADWSAADRPSELHVFHRGGHGFGMIEQGTPSDRWTDLFLAWLADLDVPQRLR